MQQQFEEISFANSNLLMHREKVKIALAFSNDS